MFEDEFAEFAEFEDEFAEFEEESLSISDPLQGMNRLMFKLNDKVYYAVIRPLARGYKKVTPRPARISLRNFFHNLAGPGRFANCVLQGKGRGAKTEFKRFVVNSTVGILGLADPAKTKMDLDSTGEDLGQTLAVYGFGNGFYVVWPFFGPSTLRDTIGRAGDSFANPVVYIDRTDAYLVLALAKSANEYSFRLGDYEALNMDALDPYVVMRNAYLQYRNQQISE